MAATRASNWAGYNARQTTRLKGDLGGKGWVRGNVVGADGQIVGRRADLAPFGGGVLTGALAVDVKWQGLDAIRRRLERASKRHPRAVALALNRTAETARGKVTRALVKQTGLKFGVIRKATSIWRANAGNLSAEIRTKGGFTSLKEFGARQTKKGVSAAPWGRRQVFDGTFIVRRYGGHVYKREGRARFPIQKLYGPAIPVEMVKGQSAQAFYRAVETDLPRRLEHELDRALAR